MMVMAERQEAAGDNAKEDDRRRPGRSRRAAEQSDQ